MNENVKDEYMNVKGQYEDFTCPDCGRKSPEVSDAGNGFCNECAPRH